MKKYQNLLVVLLGVALLGGGCRSVITKNKKHNLKPQKISNSEKDKMDMVAARYGNDILQAIKNNDYDLFIKHFIPEAKKRITKKMFEKRLAVLKQRMGVLSSQKFITVLNQNLFRTYVWKTEFIRHKDKKPVTVEEIFRITILKLDDQYYVLNFYLY